METTKKRFIPVDELQPKVSIEQAAAHYGANLPPLAHIGTQIRSKCFLNCGKEHETGNRALAIDSADPTKKWKCFQQGCGRQGNLVSLCDLLKPGDNMGGRPRGDRFKAIARDLEVMVNGEHESETVTETRHDTKHDPAILSCSKCSRANPMEARFCHECGTKLEVSVMKKKDVSAIVGIKKSPENVPLSESDNERARTLVTLDAKFLLPSEIEQMPPAASRWFRLRPWITDEVARKFRIGYLPRDSGGDKSGGTMRDRIVFCYLDDEGRELTWFGTDPAFEEKHTKWERSGGAKAEPQPVRWVKGFQRGIELYGQHIIAQEQDRVQERLSGLGLPIVAWPMDVMRLHTLGVPAVALCSEECTITPEQAEKVARMVRDFQLACALLLLPCTPAGEKGMIQCLQQLAGVTQVRLGYSPTQCEGNFQGREIELLDVEELKETEKRVVPHNIGKVFLAI